MLIQITIFIYAIQTLAKECKCLKFIDLDTLPNEFQSTVKVELSISTSQSNATQMKADAATTNQPEPKRRQLSGVKTIDDLLGRYEMNQEPVVDAQDQDGFLKLKIDGLITQTMHDVGAKIKSISKIKERSRTQAPYKVGFILSLVRKSKIMLNDLFNLAVKHRDNWRALQQLKIFEFIVHTNVDTTNLVRSLVEIHVPIVQNRDNTNAETDKKRVVLI